MKRVLTLMVGLGLIVWTLGSPVCGTAAEQEGPATFKVSEFTFTRPADWKWIPSSSPMRAAQLAPPAKAGEEAAEVVFFYFGPGNGGGTDANVERWLGQFKEPKSDLKAKVEEVKKAGRKVTYVRAEGTYLSGSPFGPKTPKPGYALAGAILESERGNVFVKMTGPTPTVGEATPEFRKMVESPLK